MSRMTTDATFERPAAPRHFIPVNGWSVLARLISEEVLASASDEQSTGFFVAVGRRIASLASLEGIDDLEAIVERMNDVWAMLGFGRASLEFDDDGIDVLHTGLPRWTDEADDLRWATATAALLQGAYDGWFRALGSQDNLRTRIRKQSDGFVELRHGL